MFHETPIYNRLVAERGDIPTQVRGEADRIRRELARILPPLSGTAPWTAGDLSARPNPAGPGFPPLAP
ncbi:hypothetical protein [Streptomyces sp. NPDC006739]|uniref:hypothetical protein n=1 Tax=Streptomyces sp. NPDC006739 TaxID=3364763 RepID=UPI003676288E